MRRPFVSVCFALVSLFACGVAAFAQEGGLPLPVARTVPTIRDVDRLCEKRDWEGVLDATRRALASAEYWFPDDRADLLLLQADALLNLGRNEEAIRAAVEGIGTIEKAYGKPHEQWFLRTVRVLAKARMRLGRFAEARQVLEELGGRFSQAARQAEFLDLRAILDTASGFEVREDYAGKFDGRPEIAEEYERLRAALPRAIEIFERRLETFRSRLPPGRVVLRDPKDEKEDNRFGMMAGRRLRGEHAVALVFVNPRVWMFGHGGEAASLAHELTHVLRAQADGEALPFWMEEGIAHWVEDETEESLWDRVVTNSWSTGKWINPEPIRVALAEPGNWGELPEDLQRVLGLLVFRHVERTRGTETARRLVKALVDCRAYPAGCFWSVVRVGPEELAREAAAAFWEWRRKALPGFEEIPAFYGVLPGAKPAELVTWVEGFVNRNRGSPLCAPVVLDTLYRMTREKRTDHSDRLLELLRVVVAGDSSWTFTLLREEFRIAVERRDLPAARRLRKELATVALRLTEAKQEKHRKDFDEALAACELAAGADGAGNSPKGSGSK